MGAVGCMVSVWNSRSRFAVARKIEGVSLIHYRSQSRLHLVSASVARHWHRSPCSCQMSQTSQTSTPSHCLTPVKPITLGKSAVASSTPSRDLLLIPSARPPQAPQRTVGLAYPHSQRPSRALPPLLTWRVCSGVVGRCNGV